ncbi:glutathione S-transferase 1-1-like [Eupeodes corollae]|uniref:glutathione S-transferase 1-1-like n=1 Tax=Eupeodes corollae TaxID=290404 RepID=UPI002491E7DB|nr:glutathione S-transferase 1-1-like [Eupeodes corollae]
MAIKLYGLSDGPRTIAVIMTMKALDIPYELISTSCRLGQQKTESFALINPQKEIPAIDDNGFYLQETIAIIIYLCNKYAPDSPLYPKDPVARAIVNQRLCFNMGYYFTTIGIYTMGTKLYDAERTPELLKKVENSLNVFEIYLERANTKYAAGDKLTVADFALIASTLCLESAKFDLSAYPLIKKWYETFKQEYPELWEVGNVGLIQLDWIERNLPSPILKFE